MRSPRMSRIIPPLFFFFFQPAEVYWEALDIDQRLVPLAGRLAGCNGSGTLALVWTYVVKLLST